MRSIATGRWICAALMILSALRVPIGIAMFAAGSGGYLVPGGFGLARWLTPLKNLANARLSNDDPEPILRFLLMGQFATHGGLLRCLFRFVSAFLGHQRGGIAMAAFGACAGFGALCGSFLATAATMGQVALPGLKRHRYAGSLATGALAAGGTPGIVMPPSVPLVTDAILTQESIGRQFMAAILSGLIAMFGYMAGRCRSWCASTRCRPGRRACALARAAARPAGGVAGAAAVCGGDRRHLRWLRQPHRGGSHRRGGLRCAGRHRWRHAPARHPGQCIGHGKRHRDDFLLVLRADMLNTALSLSLALAQMPAKIPSCWSSSFSTA